MLKKFTVVSVGVAAALVAAAPLASASECHDGNDGGHGDHGHHKSWDGDHDGHGHHGHGGNGGHGSHGGNSNGGRDGGDSNQCSFRAGSGDANTRQGDAGLAGNINAVAPVGGVVAPVLSCDNISILNNSLDGNQINLLSSL